jgi:hypothetical protein
MSDHNTIVRELLTCTLAAAVPLRLAELDSLAGETRTDVIRAWREDALEQILAHGDIILYPAKKRGETAAAFNTLARGLAVMALNPGGVAFIGQVWCAAHSPFGTAGGYPCAACLAAEPATEWPHPSAPEVATPPRPVVDVQLPGGPA